MVLPCVTSNSYLYSYYYSIDGFQQKKMGGKIINLDHLFSEELKSASETVPTPLVKLKALTNTIWE